MALPQHARRPRLKSADEVGRRVAAATRSHPWRTTRSAELQNHELLAAARCRPGAPWEHRSGAGMRGHACERAADQSSEVPATSADRVSVYIAVQISVTHCAAAAAFRVRRVNNSEAKAKKNRRLVEPKQAAEVASAAALVTNEPALQSCFGLVRACFGPALGLLWACFGSALGLLWVCFGRPNQSEFLGLSGAS